MSEALFDLEQVLRSKKVTLTSGEANLISTWKSKAVEDFVDGAIVGSSVSWLATWRLNRFWRVNLTGGAAVFWGLRRFVRSLDSSVEHILAQDGSQIQKELANIIVNKYWDDPRIMRHLSKHFYSEKVYDDSTSEQPKLRWRFKNFYSDHAAYGQETHDSDLQGETRSDSHNYSSDKPNKPNSNAQRDFSARRSNKEIDTRSKQIPVTPDVLMVDPLDSVFGNLAAAEEIHHHGNPSVPTRAHTRSHRRSHRRRRNHHQEHSSDPKLDSWC